MTTLRILIFAHDNQGLSSTSRAIDIATSISRFINNCSILLLTDVPVIGKLKLPDRLDYVHLPTIARRHHEGTLGPNLNIEIKDVLKIRRKIAQSTIKTFKPDLFFIDCHPLELPSEMERILAYVKKEFPHTQIVWGLPDTIGDDRTIQSLWNHSNGFAWMSRMCNEIWVYGSPEVFDYQEAYRLDSDTNNKLFYTGYLSMPHSRSSGIQEAVENDRDEARILLVAGSGSGGFSLIEHFVSFIESHSETVAFKSTIVVGPSISSDSKNKLQVRINNLPNVALHRFSKRFRTYVHDADLVIWTGGYNLLCSIVTYHKKALLVPDNGICHDHISRAAMLQGIGLVEILSPRELTPQRLGQKMLTLLRGEQDFNAELLPMNGMERIVEQVKQISHDRGSLALDRC